MIDLNIIWFILFVVLIIGYAILDGFDLGVGVIQLFTKDEHERKININAIGPVWDGNEVWLLTAGGALFAAFPIVYATVFSGFYIAFMLLLFFLIFRAVSFEFRKYSETIRARKIWDNAFAIGSLGSALLFGVAIGNIMRGIPIELTDGKVFSEITFLGLLNPYSLLIGILGLIMFTMHGAIYLTLKSDGNQREKMILLASKLWMAFTVLYIVSTIYTFFEASYLFVGILKLPMFWVLFIVMLGSIIYIPMGLKARQYGKTFLASSLNILSIIGLLSISLFPNLVPSSIDFVNSSLTIYNASSTERTLETMLIIVLIGLPFVVIYTIGLYKIFKGKVVLSEDSY